MWKYEKDSSACIITAEKHIESCHSSFSLKELPKTAVLFYMRGGVEYTCKTTIPKNYQISFRDFLTPALFTGFAMMTYAFWTAEEERLRLRTQLKHWVLSGLRMLLRSGCSAPFLMI